MMIAELEQPQQQEQISEGCDLERLPSLLVTLTEDVGRLPKGLVYRLPRSISLALIQRRAATPVASLDAFPDLDVSTDEELEAVGIDWALIQSIKQ
jgi:hypothetical protein